MSNDELIESNREGFLDIQLTVDEVKELMSVLEFTIRTSKVLSDTEMVKGTFKGAAKMNAYCTSAQKLLEVVMATAKIGYVDPDIVN